MFFPRLRRHAKWMFLFLALVFALGFVGFGVGAGGVGFGDILKGAGGSGAPSISKAEQKTLDNPKDAQAFKDLSTAYQADGQTDNAIEALTSYSQLRPKDTDALRQLAALYLQKASDAQQRAQIFQYRSAYLAPGGVQVLDLTGIKRDLAKKHVVPRQKREYASELVVIETLNRIARDVLKQREPAGQHEASVLCGKDLGLD
jgi:hypothetical protein